MFGVDAGDGWGVGGVKGVVGERSRRRDDSRTFFILAASPLLSAFFIYLFNYFFFSGSFFSCFVFFLSNGLPLLRQPRLRMYTLILFYFIFSELA